jgi:hypothetical protein
LDFLADAGVMCEQAENVGADYPRYDYELNPDWTELLDQNVHIERPPGGKPLEEIARQLAAVDRATLEIAATMVYLQEEERCSGEELDRELVAVKGHLREFEQRRIEAEDLLAGLCLSVP